MFDHVSEAPKVPGLVRISPLSGDLRSFGGVVKRGQNSIKISMHLNFGPWSPVEFEAFIKKNWTGLLWNQLNCFRNEISRIFLFEQFYVWPLLAVLKGHIGLVLDGEGRWRAIIGWKKLK